MSSCIHMVGHSVTTARVWWQSTSSPLGCSRVPDALLPALAGENLASVVNERWRRSTSHPPWGHCFGETSSCKDIVIGLCIGFELQS
uniref:Uncharacterized protein n=1 Tax=Oryza rufipogon TaxID=4529 RepID=A0A0E0N1W5_ORYRU